MKKGIGLCCGKTPLGLVNQKMQVQQGPEGRDSFKEERRAQGMCQNTPLGKSDAGCGDNFPYVNCACD